MQTLYIIFVSVKYSKFELLKPLNKNIDNMPSL